MTSLAPSRDQVLAALAGVRDPELHRPLVELGMVPDVRVGTDASVEVDVLITTAGCPMRSTIEADVVAAVRRLDGVGTVRVGMRPMDAEQRRVLAETLRGPAAVVRGIPFAAPGSLTRVVAVASGKGGVGKSSVTVNLAVAMAARGLAVGVLDADVYGHSVPRMLGANGRPTRLEGMILPVPAHGVRVISMEMFKADRDDPVVWRGPMLHRALEQFLTDVHWGDLDVLLLDLPPGTGDVAISLAQMLPSAEILVVTTPQAAAAEVASRAGAITTSTHQRVVGVVENMAWLDHAGERVEVFGSGGGAAVAERLSAVSGSPVPLLGQVPLDVRLREGGDAGLPVVLAAPDSAAAVALTGVADTLLAGGRGLVGRPLTLTPR